MWLPRINSRLCGLTICFSKVTLSCTRLPYGFVCFVAVAVLNILTGAGVCCVVVGHDALVGLISL
jgi:hypothetical protein